MWPTIFEEYEAHDPLNGVDFGPCSDFAPDSLGDDPEICTTCFYHLVDHIIPADKECGS